MRAIRIAMAGLLAACGPKAGGGAAANPEAESAAAKQAIDAANQDLAQHLAMGHGDIVAAQYPDDAHMMVVNEPVAEGRAAIAAMFNGLAPMKPTIILTADKVTASGPIAVERGKYTLTISPPGA